MNMILNRQGAKKDCIFKNKKLGVLGVLAVNLFLFRDSQNFALRSICKVSIPSGAPLISSVEIKRTDSQVSKAKP